MSIKWNGFSFVADYQGFQVNLWCCLFQFIPFSHGVWSRVTWAEKMYPTGRIFSLGPLAIGYYVPHSLER